MIRMDVKDQTCSLWFILGQSLSSGHVGETLSSQRNILRRSRNVVHTKRWDVSADKDRDESP